MADDDAVTEEEREELIGSLPSLLSAPPADELHGVIVAGGRTFEILAAGWRRALGADALEQRDEPETSTPRGRLSLLMLLASQAQAVQILVGRGERPHASAAPQPDPADGITARQRGALKACCATLRLHPPDSAESPAKTLVRLRIAAEKLQPPRVSEPNPNILTSTLPTPGIPPTATTAGEVSKQSPGGALLQAPPTVQQRQLLERVCEGLREDYATRRALLIKRLDVLIASFAWCERAKPRREEMLSAVAQARGALPSPPAVSVEDALAARADLLGLQCASSLVGGGDSSVKKVRIGRVPDRGGRANESYFQRESFGQQQQIKQADEARRAGAAGGGKGGGKGGGGKGGGSGGGSGGGKGGGKGGRGGGRVSASWGQEGQSRSGGWKRGAGS